ncbi:MAG: hypothetical protein JXA74_12265 [Anaerolineae bacterium]|nr:hypothetical protein [Anaerolineae bacterium]
MHRGRVFFALVLGMMLAMSGCARSKPTAESALEAPDIAGKATAESLSSQVTYRLAEPIGANQEEVPGPIYTVLVENCAGSSPLERTHRESHALQPDVVVDTAELEPSLAAQQAAMVEAVRQGYGLTGDRQEVEDTVPLSAPPKVQVEYQLRWEETHDANVLEALAKDEVVARIPVRVVQSAQLVPLSSALVPCPGEHEVSVPVIVTEERGVTEEPDVTPEPSPSQTQSAQATLPPPGSDLAMGLVREYLAALDDGDLESAYSLLHEVYQERVSFESYQEGYATLEDLEVHSIEVVQVSKYLERAEALVTLVMQVRGEERYSDWRMTLDVSITRGKPPYQRSISAVRMQELGLQ